MKYVLTWTVSVWVSMECPDYKPDPYTGEYPSMHCLVNHGEFVAKEMTKSFETKEEAEMFMNNAPDDIKSKMKLVEV